MLYVLWSNQVITAFFKHDRYNHFPKVSLQPTMMAATTLFSNDVGIQNNLFFHLTLR